MKEGVRGGEEDGREGGAYFVCWVLQQLLEQSI